MTQRRKSHRDLKRKILALLQSDDFAERVNELFQWPPRQVVNPLFASFLSVDEQVKWRAVTAMGAVVPYLAERDLESARVIMRRLMWSLNDESGGIGWGAPEAMGEIIASHEGLAREFLAVLLSYVNEEGNFLEYEPLQRGAVWGVGRVAQVRPETVESAVPHLISFLDASDAILRGLSAWALGLIGSDAARPGLEALAGDDSSVPLYLEGELSVRTVGGLASEALAAIPEE
jgi:hypothetical protein